MNRRQFTDEHRVKLSEARKRQWENGRSVGIACWFERKQYRSIAAACEAAGLNPYKCVNGRKIYEIISTDGQYIFENKVIMTDWKLERIRVGLKKTTNLQNTK